jgi:hypothetical protein
MSGRYGRKPGPKAGLRRRAQELDETDGLPKGRRTAKTNKDGVLADADGTPLAEGLS